MDVSHQDYSELAELINHAALEPSEWIVVLKRLAHLTGCIAGGLTIENFADGTGEPIDYFGFDPAHVEKTWLHYLPLNPLFSIASRLQLGVLVTNGMVVPTESFTKTEFYDGWARPQGLCCPVTLVLHRSDTAYIPLTLVRPDGAGEVTAETCDFLSRVAPLLIRAFALTMRLDRLRDRELALDDALSRLSIALILLEGNGTIVFANQAAEDLLREEAGLRMHRRCLDIRANPDLRTAVAAACGATPRISEVVLHREGKRPFLATVMPVKSGETMLPVTGRAVCAIAIGPGDRPGTGGGRGLAKAYGLTPKEVLLLDAILAGHDLGAAADLLSVSRHTAKTHLRSIFAKTDVSRQSELIRLAHATRTPTRAS